MSSDEIIRLSADEVRKLPHVLATKYLFITRRDSIARRKLFIQRFEGFAVTFHFLLRQLEDGEITELSFNDEVLGQFKFIRDAGGRLSYNFIPKNPLAIEKLRGRLFGLGSR